MYLGEGGCVENESDQIRGKLMVLVLVWVRRATHGKHAWHEAGSPWAHGTVCQSVPWESSKGNRLWVIASIVLNTMASLLLPHSQGIIFFSDNA